MRPLVWFRADLRVSDNTALYEACELAERGVIGVFLIAADQWREHDWGAMKVDFVRRNVAELRDALRERNIPLLIRDVPRFDDAAAVLLELAEEHACDALLFNREYEVNERHRDKAVMTAFRDSDREVRVFDDQTVIAPGDVCTNDGGWYSVYSPFRRKWVGVFKESLAFQVLGKPKKQGEMVAKADEAPASIAGFDGEARDDLWPAGERTAQKQLDDFISERGRDYKDDRDYPGIEGTSRLSAYLAHGVVSPRQCLAAALEANQNKIDSGQRGLKHWIDELIWREFYKSVLMGWPRVCMGRAFRPETEALTWNDDAELFEAWCEGRTGVPLVDAGMRQLREEGWMHNRVRMVAAMYLTKDCFIDWRKGERWFMQHLVDGDLASNNGGWQWSASTGTDAAPYFRMFNPFTQGKRFDPEGVYIRRYVEELREVGDDLIHEPHKADEDRDGDQRGGYPAPLVDHKAARDRVMAAFQGLKD